MLRVICYMIHEKAGVAELVDARGLGPRGVSRVGSSPTARTFSFKISDFHPSGDHPLGGGFMICSYLIL